MKKTFTTITILLGSLTGFSQANFYKLGIGFNAGLSTAYTGLSYTGDKAASDPKATKDMSTNKSTAFGGSIDYYFTPFLNAGIEYNMVQLKDGPDQYKRQFVSDFSSIEFRANVSAGQFFDFSYSPLLYSLRTFNVGLGFGVVSGKNNVKPYNIALDGSKLDPPGLNNQEPFSRQHGNDIGKEEFSNVFTIPASIGYNFFFYNAYDEAFLQLGLNYKVVFTTSDDIDGYNDNPAIITGNKAKDIYTTLGVSLKYMFGPRRISFR